MNKPHRGVLGLLAVTLVVAAAAGADPPAGPSAVVDLAALDPGLDPLTRVAGYEGDSRTGFFGIPLASDADVDGDGHQDAAMAYLSARPLDRIAAGEVYLVFGDGTLGGTIDLAVAQPRVLRIVGDVDFETAGVQIRFADVTGDGVGDLLVARMNHSLPDRLGAGALSVIAGGPELRTLASAGEVLDLRAPDPTVTVFTMVGPQPLARFGVYVRSGDLDGDGIADLVIGADQLSSPDANHHGGVYAVLGGPHLATSDTVDLATPGGGALSGRLARVTPPSGSEEFHLGATCMLADLDGNGRAEIVAAATLNRFSAIIGPTGFGSHASGGAPGGRVYVVWDDAVPACGWSGVLEIDLDSPPASLTVIEAGERSAALGEEMAAGDFNRDHRADLFLGDLSADGSEAADRPQSGVGTVLFRAEKLRGRRFSVDDPPPGVRRTRFLGPEAFALGSDCAAVGDFDHDGIDDLLLGSPNASPAGRFGAGIVHALFGRPGSWPTVVDSAPGQLPQPNRLRVTEIWGARGFEPGDLGDTLGYSVRVGDLDGDGYTDAVIDEMLGHGVDPLAVNIGTMLWLSGRLIDPGPQGPPH